MNQTNNLRFSSQRYVSNDATTAYEFAKNFQRQDYLLPEMRLIWAVLADAIECFQKYLGAKGRREQRIFRETEAWIDSRDLRSPYSFEQICALLQLDPEYLRRGLRQWRAAHEAGARRVNGAAAPLAKPNDENSTAQAANAFF